VLRNKSLCVYDSNESGVRTQSRLVSLVLYTVVPYVNHNCSHVVVMLMIWKRNGTVVMTATIEGVT